MSDLREKIKQALFNNFLNTHTMAHLDDFTDKIMATIDTPSGEKGKE